VHDELCPEPSVKGLQFSPLRPVAGRPAVTETVPPLPEMVRPVPSSEAPSAFVTPIEALLAVVAGVTCTTAATPSAMVCWFNPNSTQVYDPPPFAQETDFPAAVAAGPAVALTEATSAVEKFSFHCRAAG
jgi:hypothetical protein